MKHFIQKIQKTNSRTKKVFKNISRKISKKKRLQIRNIFFLFVAVSFLTRILGCAGGEVLEVDPVELGEGFSSGEDFSSESLASSEILSVERSSEGLQGMASVPSPVGRKSAGKKSIETKLIRQVRTKIRVEDHESARSSIQKIISQYDAYIESERQSQERNQISTTFRVRVPAKNLDRLLEEFLNIASYVHYKEIDVQDRTADWVDLSARLKNRKEIEVRYLELLKKAENIEDILNIETRLVEVREWIESVEKQLEYLNQQVSYSLIDLVLYQNLTSVETLPEEGFWAQIQDSFRSGWNILLIAFYYVLTLWPLWVLIVVVFFYFRYRKKAVK